jgi:ABC-type sugar transport system ATPase subunit
LEEVLAEADRILVMYKGRITGEFPAGARQEDLLAAATGGRDE